jgi:hypothetical protein
MNTMLMSMLVGGGDPSLINGGSSLSNRPCSLPSSLGPYPTLLPSPLDSSPHRASLRHWPKTYSSPLSSPGCSLVDQQRIHPSVLLARASDQELLLSFRKLHVLVWYSKLSDFPILRPSCIASGRRICNGRLLHSSLHGQNTSRS